MEQNDNAYKGKTVLVTGCSGLLGFQLCTDLLEKGANVRGYSRSEPSALIKDKNFQWKKGDILETEPLTNAAEDAEIIFHLAAQPSVYDSLQDPVNDYAQNALGTLNVLKAASNHVIFSSSIALYPKKANNKESDIQLQHPYAISKYSAELFCRVFSKFGISATVLRFGYIYGLHARRGVVYDVFKQMPSDEITLYVNPTAYLDMIYAKDASSAILKAGLSGKQGPFNISAGQIQVSEIIRTIAALYGKNPKIHLAENIQGIHQTDWHHTMDASKARKELDWQPRYSFETAINEIHKELLRAKANKN